MSNPLSNKSLPASIASQENRHYPTQNSKWAAVAMLIATVVAAAIAIYFGSQVWHSGASLMDNIHHLMSSIPFDATFLAGCATGLIGLVASVYCVCQNGSDEVKTQQATPLATQATVTTVLEPVVQQFKGPSRLDTEYLAKESELQREIAELGEKVSALEQDKTQALEKQNRSEAEVERLERTFEGLPGANEPDAQAIIRKAKEASSEYYKCLQVCTKTFLSSEEALAALSAAEVTLEAAAMEVSALKDRLVQGLKEAKIDCEADKKIYTQCYHKHSDAKMKLDHLKKELVDHRDSIWKAEAQQLALLPSQHNAVIRRHPQVCIQKIKKHLAETEIDKLKAYWEPHREILKELTARAGKILRIYGRSEGRASCNQRFINGNLAALKDPEITLAMFAFLQHCAKVPSLQSNQVPTWGSSFNPSSMFEFGFMSPTCLMELEVLPPNSAEGIFPKFEAYVQRKKNGYVDIVKALEGALNELEKPGDGKASIEALGSSYSAKDWSNYGKAFHKLVELIGNLKQTPRGRDELLDHAGNFDITTLEGEARTGYKDLLQAAGLKVEPQSDPLKVYGSFDDIVNTISTSAHLLDPVVSHGFDRLKLLASLCREEPILCADDGQGYTSTAILTAVIERFKKGINAENAIAAEQFHIRIVLALETALKVSGEPSEGIAKCIL